MKKISLIILVLVAIVLVGCSGNRYVKNYSGERYSSTDHCDLVNAELEYYSSGRNFSEQIDDLKKQGYKVIGMGDNDVVVNCRNRGSAVYAPFGVDGLAVSSGKSQCTATKLDKKNQKRVRKACRAVGATVALYDSQRILYLR
ncbi:MAG: hypothetical protein SPM09_00175 [Fibrobacter sp.]|uniref:hypothetical protein n=1 Tax=Fibrobacter sp. TaxID=35828 RepID=UPI002A91406B|nr:hypothetical protein [Fibrobacter sp.]MDY6262805.1 hypothetical protein [Fibrobacter sp.]